MHASTLILSFPGNFLRLLLEGQEILMLSLHLLQVSLVYVNTLMIQQVLTEPMWSGRLTAVDLPNERAAPPRLCRNFGLR